MQTPHKNKPLPFPSEQSQTILKENSKGIPSEPRTPDSEKKPVSESPAGHHANSPQTGDKEKLLPARIKTDPATTLSPLESLNEMEKVQAIGELSQINNHLDAFIREEISAFDAQNTPPTQKQLLEKWNKLTPPSCSSPIIQTWADREILQKLDQTGITLTRNHELSQIDDARKNWTSQLAQARSNADEISVARWEQMGKGIFYPEQEEERQTEISRRFSDLKNIQDQINTQPSRVLEYLQEMPSGDTLPPSVKSYWETLARKNLATRQESFYKMLIENDLKGTPCREDMLNQAEQQLLISSDRKNAYLERFTEERPLRNEDSIALPFMNTLYDLIHTYTPARDVRGERRRSIYALIAESDCEPDEKGNLIRQFARQRNNPRLATLCKEAASYLRERYERDGFGEFTSLTNPAASQTSEELKEILTQSRKKAWLTSEKKWAIAQTALNEYLEEHEGNLPTRQEWQKLLPKLTYKATRTPRRIFADDNATFQGYPLLIEKKSAPPPTNRTSPPKAPNPPELSSTRQTSAPKTWQETLTRYFSDHPDLTPKTVRQNLNTLYSQWLNRRKTSSSLETTNTVTPSIDLI